MPNFAKFALVMVVGLIVQASLPFVVNSKPVNSANSADDSAETDFKIKTLKTNETARRNPDLSPRGFSNFSKRLQDRNSIRQTKLGAKIDSKQRQVNPATGKLMRKTVTTTTTNTTRH